MSQAQTAQRVKPPSGSLLALEARWPWELLSTVALWPTLTDGPRGDGHPVLVFPGLAGSGRSTALLRRFLKALGYSPYCWDMGRNLGPRPGMMDAFEKRIDQLHQQHGRKVSLIGWSLGGIYARELAKRCPDQIRTVITLGSPFGGHANASNAARFYNAFNRTSRRDQATYDRLPHPPPVPTTSIYSRTDGIVTWHNSVQYATPNTENIEIQSSHLGLGHHPAALYAIADRLAQPEGGWRPFDRTGSRRWAFANPAAD